MDYVCPVNDLEQQLKESGEQLLVSSSAKDLLELLDKVEQLLTFVGQAPPIPMQGALVPSMGALIANELMKHSDVDVRVSVASCLCEVTRITAPEPPYKDEIMKAIFHLNVTSFGQLSNMTGHSYSKAIHVLASVAKVKSCLLMLDLECDALILEMFGQFLSTIRTNHPRTVFSDMETIMTLVIEESDEVAKELLALLIFHVRKENQNASPASWELAEKVLRNCSNTLKAYRQTIMKLTSSNPDDYPEVVTSLCKNAYGNELAVTRSVVTGNTLANGGHTKTLMQSQHKKEKDNDTQRVASVPKKIDRDTDGYHKTRLKGKELEASQNLSSSKARINNKKNNSNQDSTSNLVQEKASNSAGLSLKENSQGTKGSKGRPEKGSIKARGAAKGNAKMHGSLFNVVIKQEDEILSDSGGAEPVFREMNDKLRGRRKPSSKKHVSEGSHDKDFKDACHLKQYGEELVGHRIKVWWPLDRTYYEGAVFSYNPVEKKHKVLYADGDEEILDLREEKWKILDDIPLVQQQEQVADPPSPITPSAKLQKQNAKRKTEAPLNQEHNLGSPKSQVRDDLSKTEPTKEHELCNVSIEEDLVQIPDILCGLKSSTEKPVEGGEFGTKTGKKRPRVVILDD